MPSGTVTRREQKLSTLVMLVQLPCFATAFVGMGGFVWLAVSGNSAPAFVHGIPKGVLLILALGGFAYACVITHSLAMRLLVRPIERIARALRESGETNVGPDGLNSPDGLADAAIQRLHRSAERGELLDAVLATVPGCIYRFEAGGDAERATSTNLRAVLLSDGFEAVTGLPAAQVRAAGGFSAAVHPDDRASANAALAEHLKHGNTWELEYRVVTPSGDVRWLLDRGFATLGSDGTLLRADGVLMDVSTRAREIEEARMLRTALDRSHGEILLLDPVSQCVTYASAGARANLQRDPVGLPLNEIVCAAPERVSALLRQAQPGCDNRATWQQRRADGSQYPVELTMTLVGAPAVRQVLLIVGLDVSERQQRERGLLESEARYRRVIEATEDGIWDVDLRAGTVYMSPQARLITGYAGREGHDETDYDPAQFLDAIHVDDRERVHALAIAHISRQVQHFDCEFRIHGATGAFRWIRARGRAQWNAEGVPIRLTLCIADITERMISESILRDTVSRLGAVLEHVAEGIITFDADGRVRSFNPAAEQIFGWTRNEILDQPITCLVPLNMSVLSADASAPGPHSATAVTEPAVARSGETWDVRYKHLEHCDDTMGVRRAGDSVPVEFAVTRLSAAGHELYTAVVRDVSMQRRTEEELRNARDIAESSLRAKSDFLAVMSHEIRTPLNGVLGMAQLLLDTDMNSEQQDTVRMIQRSGDGLLTIINDLLDFSKIEAGRMQLESAAFDLHQIIRDVFDLVSLQVREQGVELVLDYAGSVPRVVLGDSARVRQVLVNLVGNAVKFTERGHVAVAVRVLEQGHDRVRMRIAVEDSGIGIDPVVQTRLFTAFSQADASTTRRFGGTGLGLAICRQLVDLMGGELTLQSVPGAGSVFSMDVSFSLTEHVAVPRPLLSGARHVGLLVPYRRTREILARELHELGCTTIRLSSIDELQLAAVHDLLIVDRAVLGADSARLGQALRARGQECLLLVAGGVDGDREGLRNEGFAGVVARPVGGDELRAAIDALRSSPVLQPSTRAPQLAGGCLRVLVADDNAVNQHVAMRMLQRLGCDVLLADDGLAALEAWRVEALDLVLMDVRMPTMDGLVATASIRAEELARGNARVPIVGISANASPADEQLCRDAGMDGFVPKPIKLLGLEQMINSLVRSPPSVSAQPG